MKDTLDTTSTALLLELGRAANRNGLTPHDLKWLSVGDRLAQVLPIIRKNAIRHIIDLAADPYCPNDWTIEEHRKGNADFEFDPSLITFHLSEKQKDGKTIKGNQLRKELKDLPVFNANLLDYLLENPYLIPDEWKKTAEGKTRLICFWGTIYRYSYGPQCVRVLYWDNASWCGTDRDLNFDWGSQQPAACLDKARLSLQAGVI